MEAFMKFEDQPFECDAVCPKCDGTDFVSQSTYAQGYPIVILKCKTCGAVLGAVNAPNQG
jgi:transcription elongation factor Elf1